MDESNRIADRLMASMGVKVQRGSSRGLTFKVLSSWRGILDFKYHAFYIISLEDGDEVIRYVINVDIGAFGGVTDGWYRVGRLKPEKYSHFLRRHGWKQFETAAQTLEYIRKKVGYATSILSVERSVADSGDRTSGPESVFDAGHKVDAAPSVGLLDSAGVHEMDWSADSVVEPPRTTAH